MRHRPIAARFAVARLNTVLCWALVALCWSVPAPAGTAEYGPPIGNTRYSSSIQGRDGVPDLDDYVGALAKGEQLTVIVVAGRKTDLKPGLVLLRPDDTVVQPELKTTRNSRKVALRQFSVDQTGRWTVRLIGRDLSEGAYKLRFKVRPAPDIQIPGHLGGADPLTGQHLLDAVDPSDIRLDIRWAKRDSAVALTRLDDPAGDPVAGDSGDAADEAVTKKRRTRLASATLAGGDGLYAAGVSIVGGQSTYTLSARIRPLDRASSRKTITLSATEPWLDPVSGPIRGVRGEAVRFTGADFSEDEAPQVLFGDFPGTDVQVAPGGAQIDVRAPATGAGVVRVTLINPDGQAVSRNGYFQFSRPPVATGILHLDRDPAVGGSTLGGQNFIVTGEELGIAQQVFFGVFEGTVLGATGTTELTVRSPAQAPGFVSIRVVDAFDRASTAPGTFEYKAPPLFDAQPYAPSFGDPSTPITVTVTGSGFLDSDVFYFDGQATARTLLDPGTFTFDVPSLPRGGYSIELEDRLRTLSPATEFVVKGAPSIGSISFAGGSYSGTDGVPLNGGALVEVAGSDFHSQDTVTVGGVEVAVTDRDFDSFRFLSPPGTLGLLDIEVVDEIARGDLLADALRRFGFGDVSGSRAPLGGVVDDLSGWRGALGDLDGDGDADDLVITSYSVERNNVYRGFRTPGSGVSNSPGLRSVYTRLFLGDADGILADRTATHVPFANTDPSGTDNWNGNCLAVGDVDDTGGPDVLVGGVSPDYTYYNDVRIFTNSGDGHLTLETTDVLPTGYYAAVYATDENATRHLVFSPLYVHGMPTAMDLGDLDDDGDLDLVVARDWYDATYAYVDPVNVDFTQTPPYVTSANANNSLSYNVYYYSATKVFINDLDNGGGWGDATASSMPAVGDSVTAVVPAMHARDLKLGDVDRDGDLDMVLTWDNPLSVSAFGLYSGNDPARVATRVLTNDGSGAFTDVTSSWLPPGLSPEWWHASRLVLHDLDGDFDLDLVMTLDRNLEAHLGTSSTTRHALRVLRNDGSPTGFVDVTATSLPSFSGTSSSDDLRGDALTVEDVDGDGNLDILVGTTSAIFDGTGPGERLRSTRLLLGDGALVFRRADQFLPPVSVDSGEANDLLLGDPDGDGGLSLYVLTERGPANGATGDALRISDRSE